MGWGSYLYTSTKKKSTKKKAANWFEKLSVVQLKELLAAAKLAISGSKVKQIQRLLDEPSTTIYSHEVNHMPIQARKKKGAYLTVKDIQVKCREAGVSPTGDRYTLVLRVLEHENKNSCDDKENQEPPKKKTEQPKLTGEDLKKRTKYRWLKLNKQIDERLTWKSSFAHMQGSLKGGRAQIDCSEPEVFMAMFGGANVIKMTSGGAKLSRSFKTDDEIEEANLFGKSYRYGACASLKAPASVNLNNGKLTFTFKYTVDK